MKTSWCIWSYCMNSIVYTSVYCSALSILMLHSCRDLLRPDTGIWQAKTIQYHSYELFHCCATFCQSLQAFFCYRLEKLTLEVTAFCNCEPTSYQHKDKMPAVMSYPHLALLDQGQKMKTLTHLSLAVDDHTVLGRISTAIFNILIWMIHADLQ